MFIRLSKGKYTKGPIVYLVEGYYDENKKVKQRTLKSFGYLSNLIKDNPNALSDLKNWAKEQTKLNKNKKMISINLDLDLKQGSSAKALNYGYLFLEAVYNELEISKFMNDYQTTTKFSYPLDDILKLLVFSRCLNPESKIKTLSNKNSFFYEVPDVPIESVYRSLDHLAKIKDNLMYHIHQAISKKQKRDISLVFYDVTNYYFESDKTGGLRQNGVSKEKKKTGIVQMGLFIDNKGIPITYELFPGNTNDLSTMRPILEKIKKRYGLGKITIVADKGNNSGSNLAYIDSFGDNYIISQKIRGRGTKMSDIVLDQEGYQYSKDGSFKHKAVKRVRTVKNEDGTTYDVNEHMLCFWSENEELYQKNKRGLLDEKIEKYIETPSLLNASNSFGIKKYFKKIAIDSKTGEVIKTKPKYVFNEKKYLKDVSLDGYYAIVTNDLDLHPFDIIKSYRKLSSIEDSFRVTKTDLEGRPVYVSNDEHIQGHFLTCYLALTIYRLLQLKLDKIYPVHQLKQALNSASAVKLEKDIYLLHDTTNLFKELIKSYDSNIDYKYMALEKIRRELKKIV